MKNVKFKKVALWFFILQFLTGTPGRFLRVGAQILDSMINDPNYIVNNAYDFVYKLGECV